MIPGLKRSFRLPEESRKKWKWRKWLGGCCNKRAEDYGGLDKGRSCGGGEKWLDSEYYYQLYSMSFLN